MGKGKVSSSSLIEIRSGTELEEVLIKEVAKWRFGIFGKLEAIVLGPREYQLILCSPLFYPLPIRSSESLPHIEYDYDTLVAEGEVLSVPVYRDYLTEGIHLVGQYGEIWLYGIKMEVKECWVMKK